MFYAQHFNFKHFDLRSELFALAQKSLHSLAALEKLDACEAGGPGRQRNRPLPVHGEVVGGVRANGGVPLPRVTYGGGC